jgi:hypothetical protein
VFKCCFTLTDLNLHCVKHFGQAHVPSGMLLRVRGTAWDEDEADAA